MTVATVKIRADSHATLAGLAAEQQQSMGALLADFIERQRRRCLFDEADAADTRLKANPEAWAEYQAELKSMAGTLMDGLEDDPWVE